MIQEFDAIRKYITSDEGKTKAKEFRKLLVRSEKYSLKLDQYFVDTLDGMSPETAKELNGL